MSEAKNIGTFELDINTWGHNQKIHGSVFLDKETGEHSAQIDDGIGKYFSARTVGDAVVLAIREFVENRR
jgi:hypothetical protein